MIDRKLVGEVLAKAVSGGADFAEIFCELTCSDLGCHYFYGAAVENSHNL